MNSEFDYKGKNQIALTLLPGHNDMKRIRSEDIELIKAVNISNVLTLVTNDKLHKLGVPKLISHLKQEGITYLHVPIKDQGIPSSQEIEFLCNLDGGKTKQR